MIHPVPGRMFTPSSRSAPDEKPIAPAGRATVSNDSAVRQSTTATGESGARGAAESLEVSEVPVAPDA
jgi:hypothetical protein